jgi:hypothetical protein
LELEFAKKEKLKLEFLEICCWIFFGISWWYHLGTKSTRLLRGQDIFGIKGFLTIYCDKKRGAVEISHRQFVDPDPSESKGEKIATSKLCAIAVSLCNYNFV